MFVCENPQQMKFCSVIGTDGWWMNLELEWAGFFLSLFFFMDAESPKSNEQSSKRMRLTTACERCR
jgi:hypothetical protein